MPYSIPSSTKIPTLVTASFLSAPVCEFAMVSGVYILLSPQEEEMHSSS